jgi:hypothetical protein
LWSGPRKNNDSTSLVGWTGDGDYMPVLLSDIDGDGNTELVVGGQPHEPISPGFSIFRWNGKEFSKVKYADLVWMDAPKGRMLKWTKINDREYLKRNKIWWAHSIEQSLKDRLPIVSIEGVRYPGANLLFLDKAKIRFTPTGAVIEEWIK